MVASMAAGVYVMSAADLSGLSSLLCVYQGREVWSNIKHKFEIEGNEEDMQMLQGRLDAAHHCMIDKGVSISMRQSTTVRL